MFSALTSYIWGTEEETCKPAEEIHADDQVELENEWIFIRPKGKFHTLFVEYPLATQ